MPSRAVAKLLDSPTVMTWGNLGAKSLMVILVTPLVLSRLSTEDSALWYLLSSIFAVQMMLDIGLSVTFTRLIAFGYAGRSLDQLAQIDEDQPSRRDREKIDWKTVNAVIAVQRRIFAALVVAIFITAGVIGSFAVRSMIAASSSPFQGMLAWGVVACAAPISVYGLSIGARLQGLQRVALWQRTQMLFAIGTALSIAVGLLATPNLLLAVTTFHAWQIAQVTVASRLSARIVREARDGLGNPKNLQGRESLLIWSAAWPAAWRSGIGILLSAGIMESSGIFYAQFATSTNVVGYFLMLQLIRSVSIFSYAPFSARIPRFAAEFSAGRVKAMLGEAKDAMRLTYSWFLLGYLLVGLGIDPVLNALASDAVFPPPPMWEIIGIALLLERTGAMHIQLYSLTNRIIWHKANGLCGLVVVAVTLVAYPLIGMSAFPTGLLLGFGGVYAPYSMLHSWRYYKLRPLQFERDAAIPAFGIGLLFCLILLVVRHSTLS